MVITIQQAVTAHKEGRLKEAEHLYHSILKEQPEHLDANNNLGIILQNSGKLEEAEKHYRKAIDIKSNFAEAHNNLGNTLKDLGKLDEAVTSYKKAIEIKPGFFEANDSLNNLLFLIGKINDAEVGFKKMIALNPDHAEAYFNLGVINDNQNKLEEAEKYYKKTIELKSDIAAAHNNLGVILKNQDKFDESLKNFKTAIKIKSDFFEAHNNLGIALYELNRFEEAIHSHKKAIEFNPNFAEAYNCLSVTQNSLGNFDESLINCKKAIALNPNFSKAHDNLAVLLKQNKLLDAIKTTKLQKKKTKNYLDNIDINKYQPGIRLTSNPFISNRKVEAELLANLYKTNAKKLDDVDPGYLRYGNGRSSNYELFQNNSSITKTVEEDLISIMKKAVNSDIFIMESFFNIFETGSGIASHNHINKFDQINRLIDQKFSLTYYLDVGDQNCDEPGILKLYNPDEEILPSNGTIVIFPANRIHLAAYGGKTDRVMIGVNFFSLI